jgi:hypothetical protein
VCANERARGNKTKPIPITPTRADFASNFAASPSTTFFSLKALRAVAIVKLLDQPENLFAGRSRFEW